MAEARRWARRNWVLLGALAMFLGSDYKVRTRSSTAAISGGADVYVLLEIGLYALLAGYLVLFRASPPRAVRLPAPMVLTLGYGLVMVISVSTSPYPTFGAVRAVEMLIGMGLALAIGLLATRDEVHRLAHGFMVLVAVSVVYGVLVPSVPVSNQQVGRFTWLAVHPNIAGVFVGVATVTATLYLLLPMDRPGPAWPRPAYLVLLMACGYGLLGTHTRSAVLGVAVALVVSGWTYLRGSRRVEFLLGLAMAGTLCYLLVADVVQGYFARGESVEQLSTLNSRTDLWFLALDAIARRPVFGWGIGASQGIFQDRIGLGGGHNMIINVAVDLGAVGLITWLGLVGSTCLSVAVLRRRPLPAVDVDRTLIAGILTMILVNGFFITGPGGVSNVASTWLLLCVGWTTCLWRLARQEEEAARRSAAAALGRLGHQDDQDRLSPAPLWPPGTGLQPPAARPWPDPRG